MKKHMLSNWTPFFILGLLLAGTGVTAITFENPSTIGTIPELIEAILNFIFTLSFPILTGVMLYAGFVMLTSSGDANKFQQGVNVIIYASIGFLIILTSKGIVAVLKDVLGA